MLKPESQLHFSEAHLLPHRRMGLGLQVAAALARLGRKVAHLRVPAQVEESPVPSQELPYEWGASEEEFPGKPGDVQALIYTPEHELSRNESLSESEVTKLETLVRKVLSKNPSCQTLLCLPYATSAETLARCRSISEAGQIFMLPAVYGFRDEGLLDFALANPESFAAREVSDTKLPLIFSRDAAAFLVSALGHERIAQERLVLVPPQVESLREWQRAFVEVFAPGALSLKQRIRRFLGVKARELPPLSPLRGSALSEANLRNALEIFPTSISSAPRALKLVRDQLAKSPELGLHFPPARSL
jgi:hypothetical protein